MSDKGYIINPHKEDEKLVGHIVNEDIRKVEIEEVLEDG